MTQVYGARACCTFYPERKRPPGEPGTAFRPQLFKPPVDDEEEQFLDNHGEVVHLSSEESYHFRPKQESKGLFARLLDWIRSLFASIFG